jgi:hypothetical protein
MYIYRQPDRNANVLASFVFLPLPDINLLASFIFIPAPHSAGGYIYHGCRLKSQNNLCGIDIEINAGQVAE